MKTQKAQEKRKFVKPTLQKEASLLDRTLGSGTVTGSGGGQGEGV